MHGPPATITDRRALMRGAILLVGGIAVAGALPDFAFAETAAFFTPAERAILDAACEAMIPRTDTPGAIDAGVPAFIDAMMTNWANDKTQATFRAVLAEIDEDARFAGGKGFAELSPATRASTFAAFDAAAFEARTTGYRRFKELVLTGYYLSEPGATQELRYELAPGVWEPATPVTPDTRAWAVG